MNIEEIEKKYISSKAEFTPDDRAFWESVIELITNIEDVQDEKIKLDRIKKLDDFLSENTKMHKKKYVYDWIRDNSPMFRKIYIIDSQPHIDKKSGINYSEKMTAEEKVNHIAQKMRILLANTAIEDYEYSEEKIKNDDLSGECISTTEKVVKECIAKGIDAKGLYTRDVLGEQVDGHKFAIITLEGKQYIVDCTYRQFFALRNNIDGKNNVGLAMITDEGRKEIARQILTNGWIEATPENLKAYLDGFALCKSEKLPSAEEYIKMLEGKEIEYKQDVTQGKKDNTEISETTYVMESTPYIEKNADLEEYSEDMSDNEKLKRIVQRERKTLSGFLAKDGTPYDINNDNLRGDCIGSACRIREDCYAKGIKSLGLHTKNLGVNRHLGHHFNIIELNGKNYLIDCTYRQFFSETYCSPEKEHHDCGMYMVADEGRKEIAGQILTNGWIEATPENLKAYLDGFVLADRKSLEETGITYEEYIEILQKDEAIKIFTHKEIAELDKETKISQSEIDDAKKSIQKCLSEKNIGIKE